MSYTLDELRNMDCEVITPDDIAGILQTNPQTIRDTFEENPAKLGFPIIRAGRLYRIPRLAFIHYMEHGPVFVRGK